MNLKQDSELSVVVLNTSGEPAVFRSFISHPQGRYILPAYEVAPKRSIEIPLNELQDKAVPDVLGNNLPEDFDQGQFFWLQDEPEGPLLGTLQILNSQSRLASRISCSICPCYSDKRSEVYNNGVLVGSTGGSVTKIVEGPAGTNTTLKAVTVRTDTCNVTGSEFSVSADVVEWKPADTQGIVSIFGSNPSAQLFS